jgi:O-acetyl-ADP-ribose deacetylase (regulator of RNase III)
LLSLLNHGTTTSKRSLGSDRITGRFPAPRGDGAGLQATEALAACYESSLRLAAEHNLQSIAFPAISTGAYAYPLKLATMIAVSTVKAFTDRTNRFEKVIFCCFSDEDFAVYKRTLRDFGI